MVKNATEEKEPNHFEMLKNSTLFWVVHDTAFQAMMKIQKKSSRVQIQRAAETNEVFARPERVIGQLCFLFGKLIASVDHSIQA